MMHDVRTKLAAAALCLSAIIPSCTDTVSGTATEDGNVAVVTGVILRSEGQPWSGLRVSLSPESWVPAGITSLVYLDTTDANGRYTFEKIPRGTYALRAADTVAGLGINRQVAFATAAPGDVVRIDTATALALGHLRVNNLALFNGATRYLFVIRGTGIAIDMVPNTYVVLAKLAAGHYGAVTITDTLRRTLTLADSFTITPGDTTYINP